MADDWTLKLTRDEALVLADYMSGWQQRDGFATADEAQRVALNALLAALESSDDGTAFAANYAEQIAAARDRLRGEG